ncbi:MAG: hypothetical protein E8D45_04440 [Nitrospira sp.]|nr:MAG: hypothetical protein E8D45_04440 [Nitrospira sp.]
MNLIRIGRPWMRLSLLATGVYLTLSAGPEPAFAQVGRTVNYDRPHSTLTIGFREWLSQGRSAHNIAGPGHAPNVLSELTWRGLNAPVHILSVDFVTPFRPRTGSFVLNAALGGGVHSNGTLLDQDWIGNNRTGKIAETFSEQDGGHVFFISVDTGWRPIQWKPPFYSGGSLPLVGAVDLLIGFQYWKEQYQAFGVQDQLPPIGTPVPTSVKAITQTNEWYNVRLGSRITVPLHERVALTGSAFYLPYTLHQNEDVHHLRSDLQQDPSFLTKASGGNGVQLEAGLQVRAWKGLTLEAGYMYWDVRSGTGTVEAFGTTGMGSEPHNEENTRRQGLYFGLSWALGDQ